MAKKENCCDPIHRTSIGGQAVMEGVMMRGPKDIAVAVRKPDGEIIVDKRPVASFVQKYKISKIPIVRGVFSFFESMVLGIKALTFSANFIDIEGEEGEQQSKFEKWLEDKLGDKIKDIAIYFSVAVALVLSIGLFFVLPMTVVSVLKNYVSLGSNTLHLIETAVRLTLFFIYLLLVSRMQDIQRVFQYHGAEHKTIHCYEHGEELTPENVMKHTRLHPRCGTSFLLTVMVVSLFVFLFLNWGDMPYWQMLVSKILLLPVVSGLSYELIKLMGRHENRFTKICSAPGMWLQYITTREPDESQTEVAIASLKAVLTDSKEDDKW